MSTSNHRPRNAAAAGWATLAVCAMSVAAPVRADFYTNVSLAGEAAMFQPVYDLNIPVTSGGWNAAGTLTAAYSTNRAWVIPDGSFDRIGYYMELGGATNANYRNGWIFVSFDAAGFQTKASLLGVPGTPTGVSYQKNLVNMTVLSNVAGIVTGTGIQTGNIEFWPSNYTQANSRSAGNGGPVPNASASTYDFGDSNSGGSGHGSMQIHNYDLDGAGAGTAGQTLFAYNAWGTVRVSELGIGNNPVAGQAPDYTITTNADDAGAWTTRLLQVVVTPEPGTIGLLAAAALTALARRLRLPRHA